MSISPFLLKTWTKVEFPGQNDDNRRNIKDSKILLHQGKFQMGQKGYWEGYVIISVPSEIG